MASASVPVRRHSLWSGRVDILQALTGVCLALFVLLHFFIISTVLISVDVMSGIEHFFEQVWLTQIGLPGLFVVILLHFLLAARKMPFRAREVATFWRHSQMMHHTGTWIWLLQILTAVIILALFGMHLIEVFMNLPVTFNDTAARVARPGAVCFYALLLLATLTHALVGLYRVGAKFGIITRATRAGWVWGLRIVFIVYVVMALAALARIYTLA